MDRLFTRASTRSAHFCGSVILMAALAASRAHSQCVPPGLDEVVGQRGVLTGVIEVPGARATEFELVGPVSTHRVAGDGDEVQTEMVALDLRGTSTLGSLGLTLRSDPLSTGALRDVALGRNGCVAASGIIQLVFLLEIEGVGDGQNEVPVRFSGANVPLDPALRSTWSTDGNELLIVDAFDGSDFARLSSLRLQLDGEICKSNEDCGPGFFCRKAPGDCEGIGVCSPRPRECPDVVDPVCGCDGETYANACRAAAAGVSVALPGACDRGCVVGLGLQCFLDPESGNTVLLWTATENARECCREFRIRRDGVVLVDGIPVDVREIEVEGCGLFVLECIGADGQVLARALCETPCADCADVKIDLVCDPIGGTNRVALAWNVPGGAPECCDRFRILHDGATIAVVPGDTSSFESDRGCGTYRVECIAPDGTVAARDECVLPCCDDTQIRVVCDPIAGTNRVALGWEIIGGRPSCCDEFTIALNGAPIAQGLPGDTRFLEAEGCGVFEVICMRDGQPAARGSCRAPCPQCDLRIDVVCDPIAGTDRVAIAWQVIGGDERCCARFQIKLGGEVVATLPGDASSYESDLGCGRYEVECVDPDGNVTAGGGCAVPCCDDAILRLACDPIAGTDRVALAWEMIGGREDCCDGFHILRNGTPIALDLPPETRFFEARGCGLFEVFCVVDGQRTHRAECRVECPDCAPELTLTCDRIGDTSNVVLSWDVVDPAGCCDRFRIRYAGAVIATLPLDDRTYRSDRGCGSYRVECLDENGVVVGSAFCTIECPPPCDPTIRLVCDPIDGTDRVALSWTVDDPAACCDRFWVWHDGVRIATLPPTQTVFEADTGCGTYRVECADANGDVITSASCRVACPPPCEPTIQLSCDPIAGTDRIAISWTADDPLGCCDRFWIWHEGVRIATLPAGQTFFEALTGCGTYRVECADATGQVLASATCTVECPPPCEVTLTLVCEPIAGTDRVLLSWTADDPQGCCARFWIRHNGVRIATLPATETFYEADTGCGVYRVECVDASGQVIAAVGCSIACPPPCEPTIQLACDPIAGTERVALSWTVDDPQGCCDRFWIRHNGVRIATLPATETSFEADRGCGVYRVECVDAAGNVLAVAGCAVECPPCEPEIELACDPIAGTDLVALTWTVDDPQGCCERFWVWHDGVRIATLPATETFFEADAGCGVFRVECVDVAGNVITSAVCTVGCPPACEPEIEIVCDPIGDTGVVALSWTVQDPEGCCDRFWIWHDGVRIASLPGSQTFFEAQTGCGTYRVECVDAAQNVLAAAACNAPCNDAGRQLPNDCNQDGNLNIADAICFFSHLFLGGGDLPCFTDAANLQLVDSNGDNRKDLSDGVYLLGYFFLGGPPPRNGTECIPILDCPDTGCELQ